MANLWIQRPSLSQRMFAGKGRRLLNRRWQALLLKSQVCTWAENLKQKTMNLDLVPTLSDDWIKEAYLVFVNFDLFYTAQVPCETQQ